MGEVVYRLIYGELLQLRLLGGERLGGRLVGPVRRPPELMPERQHVVVQRHEIGDAGASAEIAVLLVTADAHDSPQEPETGTHAGSQGAERSLRGILVHVDHAVFEIIGRRYPI